MSKNVLLSWVDPIGPKTAVEISMKVDGAPDFTPLPLVGVGVQTLEVPALDDGKYYFRAVVINGSKRGDPVYAFVTVGGVIVPPTEDAVPGSVTLFKAVVV